MEVCVLLIIICIMVDYNRAGANISIMSTNSLDLKKNIELIQRDIKSIKALLERIHFKGISIIQEISTH